MTELLYHGTPEPRPKQHSLRAGSLTATFENGTLRYIRLGHREIVRMIYFALRDEHWATLPTQITDEQLDIRDESFELSYVCTHVLGDAEIIRWQCALSGDASGQIRFAIDGTVLHPFLRNRAGFCVLHPIDGILGQAVRIGHPDGSQTDSVFPELISPHQPFMNIEIMRWNVEGGGEAELTFDGDVFETEDQRNWSDASFKTYCTPLERPKPVQLQPGDRIQQAVTLVVTGQSNEQQLKTATPIQILSRSSVMPERRTGHSDHSLPSCLPFLGLTHAIDQPKLKTDEAAQLRKMNLNHLLLTLDFSRGDWSEWLTVGLSEAKRIQTDVILAIVFTENYQTELNQLQMAVEWLSPVIAAVEVFQAGQPVTPDPLMANVAPILRQLFAGAQLGAGSPEQFTELNRNRPAMGPLDYVVYPMNPQVHAYDDQTLIENKMAQADTLRTARSFAGEKPIHVGPITLRPRPDPVNDPRHSSLLTAGWLVGSLAALTSQGATRVTYFDTKGPKGIMQGIDPETNQGNVYPTGLVLMALADWQGAECIATQTDEPLAVSVLGLRKNGRELLVLANHTWDEQTVSLPDGWALPTQVWSLDETTAPACMQSGNLPPAHAHTDRTVMLRPFAVVHVMG